MKQVLPIGKYHNVTALAVYNYRLMHTSTVTLKWSILCLHCLFLHTILSKVDWDKCSYWMPALLHAHLCCKSWSAQLENWLVHKCEPAVSKPAITLRVLKLGNCLEMYTCAQASAQFAAQTCTSLHGHDLYTRATAWRLLVHWSYCLGTPCTLHWYCLAPLCACPV